MIRTRTVGIFGRLLAIVVLVGAYSAYRFTHPLDARGRAGPVLAGSQWRPVGLPGTTVHSIAVSPRHAWVEFAATESGIYRHQRNGSWFHMLASQAVWTVQLLPDERTVIAGDNAGNVDVSADLGVHWRQTRVTGQGVYAVTARPGHHAWLVAGAGGGMYLSRDSGLHWSRQAATTDSGIDAFAWSPGSDRVLFAGSVASSAQARTGAFVSDDAGLTWHHFGYGLTVPAGIMSLVATQRAGVFAGTMGSAVWQSTGQSWRQLADGMPPDHDHVAGLATVQGRSNMLFAATLGSGVFRTDDGGGHWVEMERGLSTRRNATIVLCVVYAPLAHALEAGTADGVYEIPLDGGGPLRRRVDRGAG
ncbi:MAG: hypothetical protein NVS4B2_25500 [Chloroflexota bacterium]